MQRRCESRSARTFMIKRVASGKQQIRRPRTTPSVASISAQHTGELCAQRPEHRATPVWRALQRSAVSLRRAPGRVLSLNPRRARQRETVPGAVDASRLEGGRIAPRALCGLMRHQHRQIGASQDPLRHSAKQGLPRPAVAVTSHHEKVGTFRRCLNEQFFCCVFRAAVNATYDGVAVVPT